MRYIFKLFTDAIFILFLISVPFTLLSMHERKYYPKVLFSTPTVLNKFTDKDMMELRHKCNTSLELTQLDGKIYIRCGMFWPKIKIYVTDEKNAPWIFKDKQKNNQEAFVI